MPLIAAVKARHASTCSKTAHGCQYQQRAHRQCVGTANHLLLDLTEPKDSKSLPFSDVFCKKSQRRPNPEKEQLRTCQSQKNSLPHCPCVLPRNTDYRHPVSHSKHDYAANNRRSVNPHRQMPLRPGGLIRQKASGLLGSDPAAENQKCPQLDQQKSHRRPQNRLRRKGEAVADDAQSHESGRDQADQLRQQYRRRDPQYQCQKASSQILCQKHGKKLPSAHSHHQVHAELMPASVHLIFSGIIYQEKEQKQGHTEKHRNHCHQPVHGMAFHPFQKQHHILPGQGQYNIKRDNGNQKRGKKQAVFLPASSAVAQN